MKDLSREHWPSLLDELGAERCCSLHASHVIATGHGAIWVDQWPAPRATAAFTGGNLGLYGDARAVSAGALGELVSGLHRDWEHVFIDPGESFEQTVRDGVPALRLWPRVLYALAGRLVEPPPTDAGIRPLVADDASALGNLEAEIAWVSDTHDGPAQLAESGHAVGAFVDDRLAAVAAVFYVGTTWEELAVVTEPDQRSRGLSTACAAAVIEAIQQRRRTPCWSTTPDNRASARIAEKLGFTLEGEQRHFMVGSPISGSLPLD